MSTNLFETNYCMTKQTSALRNTTAGYWAIVYRVIHAKYAAERTYDACVFTILPQAQ